MPPRQFVEVFSAQERSDAHSGSCALQLDVSALKALALRSLVLMFEEKEKLFYRRVSVTVDGFYHEGTSRKRTMIALLGLQRLTDSGGTQPLDLASIRDSVLRDTSWVKSAGDLGLLAWFTAECAPERLRTLAHEFDFGNALATYLDGRQARTSGLAWFLAGVAHARLACPAMLPDLTDVAVDAYHLLQNNQTEAGIFGHAAFPSIFRTFCNRFGTFADQIYAIYALTTFARAFQIEEPLGPALACANSIRALQGDMGQWWFLYDKRACRVVNRYPVCSLHQGGTAPVALLALGELTGQNFHESIYKGLSWIAGANELGTDLRSLDRGFIWDSIGRSTRIAHYYEAALSLVNIPHGSRSENLKIQYDARPDHFGWLLYAFGRFDLPKRVIAAKVAGAY